MKVYVLSSQLDRKEEFSFNTESPPPQGEEITVNDGRGKEVRGTVLHVKRHYGVGNNYEPVIFIKVERTKR